MSFTIIQPSSTVESNSTKAIITVIELITICLRWSEPL